MSFPREMEFSIPEGFPAKASQSFINVIQRQKEHE
jgi:hypothetical protein